MILLISMAALAEFELSVPIRVLGPPNSAYVSGGRNLIQIGCVALGWQRRAQQFNSECALCLFGLFVPIELGWARLLVLLLLLKSVASELHSCFFSMLFIFTTREGTSKVPSEGSERSGLILRAAQMQHIRQKRYQQSDQLLRCHVLICTISGEVRAETCSV